MAKKRTDVGYGRPPKETQFQKGQSGNPKGRPKREKPAPMALHEEIAAVLAKKVTVRLADGKTQKMSRAQAFVAMVMSEGFKGNAKFLPHAVKIVMTRGDFVAPVQSDKMTGAIVLERPIDSIEEWKAYSETLRHPLNPLEGLPGIDPDTIQKIRRITPPEDDED